MSETPLPNKRKKKLYKITVQTMDESWLIHPQAYISQHPFTDQWAVRIVEPNRKNRTTLYPYTQIRTIITEDEDEIQS